MVTLMNPKRVILSSGVTEAGSRWWGNMLSTARAYTLPETPVDVVTVALRDDAPLWGAVALVMQA